MARYTEVGVNPSSQRWLLVLGILGLFLISGTVALVYQIVWARQMGLLFGQTAQAASVVLTAFFVGLAVGYWLAGAASRHGRPLVRYGIVELLAGLTALAPLAAWWWLEDWLAHWPVVRETPGVEPLLAFVLLLPTSICLGATLPLLAQAIEGLRWPGAALLQLPTVAYSINTLGAFLGVLLATFVLLGRVGMTASSALAIGLSVAIGLVAIVLGRTMLPQTPPTATAPPREQVSSSQTGLWLVVAGVSGFCTLGLEVLYTDLFALMFHNSSYTFGMVVASFLLALSAGTLLAAWLQARLSPRVLAGGALLAGAVAVCLSVVLLVWLRGLTYFPRHDSFAVYLLGAAGLVLLVVGPAIVLLAVALPVAWRAVCADARDTGRVVGRLTAINALAGAAGAASVGFVVMPLLGLWGGFALVAAVDFVAGFWLLSPASRGRIWWGAPAAAALLLVVILVPATLAVVRPGEVLVQRWAGPYGWTDVVERAASRGRPASLRLRQNVHYGMGSTASAISERRQSRLPLILHPQPRRVFFLGLATGITASEALLHPEVEQIVVAELIPEVVEAARWFTEANFDVLNDPRVTVRVGDARHLLRRDPQQYDVIIADLFVPWESRTGYLYTVEHFRAVRARLAPGGLFCQWVPVWQVGQREWELIADSLAAEFPYVDLWWGHFHAPYPLAALVASDQPLQVSLDAVNRRLAAREMLPGNDPYLNQAEQLLDLLAGRWPRREGVPLNTDELPRIEFLAPASHVQRQLLSGSRFREYWDSTLRLLPSASVQFDPPPRVPLTIRRFEQYQRWDR